MRVIRDPRGHYEVWHDESQFEAQRAEPYWVTVNMAGKLYCTGCQSPDCVHTAAVRKTQVCT